jgi:hypothetical protein
VPQTLPATNSSSRVVPVSCWVALASSYPPRFAPRRQQQHLWATPPAVGVHPAPSTQAQGPHRVLLTRAPAVGLPAAPTGPPGHLVGVAVGQQVVREGQQLSQQQQGRAPAVLAGRVAAWVLCWAVHGLGAAVVRVGTSQGACQQVAGPQQQPLLLLLLGRVLAGRRGLLVECRDPSSSGPSSSSSSQGPSCRSSSCRSSPPAALAGTRKGGSPLLLGKPQALAWSAKQQLGQQQRLLVGVAVGPRGRVAQPTSSSSSSRKRAVVRMCRELLSHSSAGLLKAPKHCLLHLLVLVVLLPGADLTAVQVVVVVHSCSSAPLGASWTASSCSSGCQASMRPSSSSSRVAASRGHRYHPCLAPPPETHHRCHL